MARDRKKSPASDRRRVIKKKVSILSSESINWIDYKDVNLLRRFMSERAKIRARRVTGNTAQQQRAVAKAIRIAREMALLPYSVRQVTQRSKGGRRGDRDRDRYSDGPPRGSEERDSQLSAEAEIGDGAASDLNGGATNGAEANEVLDETVADAAADESAPVPAEVTE
jgi:small subunit ribosomal protein S18